MEDYVVYDYRELTDDNGYLLYDSPDEYDVFGLFYYENENVFKDDDGFIVWDIFNYITPNDLYLFRKTHETMFVNHKTIPNMIGELYYPDDN